MMGRKSNLFMQVGIVGKMILHGSNRLMFIAYCFPSLCRLG